MVCAPLSHICAAIMGLLVVTDKNVVTGKYILKRASYNYTYPFSPFMINHGVWSTRGARGTHVLRW